MWQVKKNKRINRISKVWPLKKLCKNQWKFSSTKSCIDMEESYIYNHIRVLNY